MNKKLLLLTQISAVMFGLGIILPLSFSFLALNLNIPPIIWDTLQIGGLIGLIIFGLPYRFTKPKVIETDKG
jgi:hypothetical protein